MKTEHVEYELEYLNPETEEYGLVLLDCDVRIYPAEPDVGILYPYAEIESAVDCDGKDFFDILSGYDINKIQYTALDL